MPIPFSYRAWRLASSISSIWRYRTVAASAPAAGEPHRFRWVEKVARAIGATNTHSARKCRSSDKSRLATYLEVQSARAVDLLLLCGAAATATELCLAVGDYLRREQVLFAFVQRRQISDERVAKIGSIRSRGVGAEGSLQSRTSPSEERRGYAPH